MKKLIAIALIAVMVLGLAACGAINKTEVSVLWSGDGVVKVPNSLINSMDRAMYIENITYKHYGANSSAETQLQQAKDALNAGCSALVVELVDASAAQAIVDAAKEKDVPVVFFNCEVEEAVISGYSKCVLISTNADSLNTVYSKLIASSLYTEKKGKVTLNYDRNNDGKITYASFGDTAATVEMVNTALTEKGLSALEAYAGDSIEAVVGAFTDDAAAVELIITDSDATALEVLAALQEKGYNSTKLTTHCIPVFTVGNQADAKAFTDTSSMSDEEIAALIYTVTDIIGNGQMTGTVVEDYDAIAVAVATVLRNLLKGNDTFADITTDNVVGTWAVKIPYTTVS